MSTNTNQPAPQPQSSSSSPATSAPSPIIQPPFNPPAGRQQGLFPNSSEELKVDVRTVSDTSQGRVVFFGKPLWDWLQLLLVPLLLAGLGFWFTATQHDSDQRIAQDNRLGDLTRQLDQQQEATLQSYLDHMSDLLLGNNIGKNSLSLASANSSDEISQVARARTMTVLRDLDGRRKGAVLNFLYDAKLIGYAREAGVSAKAVVDLVGADLTTVSLEGTNLAGANLEGVDLTEAHLEGANLTGIDLERGARLIKAHLAGANLANALLIGTDLTGVDLTGADLVGVRVTSKQLAQAASLRSADLLGIQVNKADLSKANLSQADLRGADLSGVNLQGRDLIGANLAEADLRGANLTNANLRGTNLTNANLRGASVMIAQLAQASSLRGVILPDGSEHP